MARRGSRYSQRHKNGNRNQIVIKCFRDYPSIEESAAFVFYLNMKLHMDSRIGISVFHVIISRMRKVESHAVPCRAMR